MTETRDPGTPRTEFHAQNTARHAISRAIDEGTVRLDEITVGDAYANSWRIASEVVGKHAATFEHDIDSTGTLVRRYVLRGQWFVDPDPDSAPADTEPVDTDTETKLRGAVEVMADSRDLWRKRAIEAGWDGKPMSMRVSVANHGVPAGVFLSKQAVGAALDGMMMLLDGMPRVSTPLGFDTVKVDRVRELIRRTAGSLGVTL